jgi:hypothetical protein
MSPATPSWSHMVGLIKLAHLRRRLFVAAYKTYRRPFIRNHIYFVCSPELVSILSAVDCIQHPVYLQGTIGRCYVSYSSRAGRIMHCGVAGELHQAHTRTHLTQVHAECCEHADKNDKFCVLYNMLSKPEQTEIRELCPIHDPRNCAWPMSS